MWSVIVDHVTRVTSIEKEKTRKRSHFVNYLTLETSKTTKSLTCHYKLYGRGGGKRKISSRAHHIGRINYYTFCSASLTIHLITVVDCLHPIYAICFVVKKHS